MRPSPKLLMVAALVVATTGFYSIGKAGYMLAKAELAQVLLNRAWTRTLNGEPDAKAWPWADVKPVARLNVPRLDESAIILSDTSGEALAFGPGPVGGEATLHDGRLKIIAAHRDSHFDFLGDVRPGDEITLILADGLLHSYRIRGAEIIDSTGYKMPRPQSDGLALVTCWPLDGKTRGPLRFILYGDAIPDSEIRTQSTSPEI